MMAGHLLHSGGEGGIGEERQELQRETSVSYRSRPADRPIVTGIQWSGGSQWNDFEQMSLSLGRIWIRLPKWKSSVLPESARGCSLLHQQARQHVRRHSVSEGPGFNDNPNQSTPSVTFDRHDRFR